MTEKWQKSMKWLLESNRALHVVCVCLMAVALGWSAGVASIIALEAKDVQRGGWACWDWLDCAAGAIGCAIGGAVHWVIFKHW